VSGDRPEQGRRLLDEALRLLDVVQASRPAGAPQDANGSAGPECRICPLCRGIAYLREVDPRAVERLTGAVADVAGAVRDLLGTTTPDGPRCCEDGTTAGAGGTSADGGVPRVRVQQIDVTD
jgi:hypothetical protein